MPEVIASPADWRGADIAKRTDWIHEFTPEEIAEIDSATRHALSRGKTMESLTKEDFPLPLNPVITTSFSRGNDRSTFFRLCTLAPKTSIFSVKSFTSSPFFGDLRS